MMNNGTGKKRVKKSRPGRSADDIDSETLADYVMGNLSEEQKQEVDRKRAADPDLEAEIAILGHILPDSSGDEGSEAESGEVHGHVSVMVPPATDQAAGELIPTSDKVAEPRTALSDFHSMIENAVAEAEKGLIPRLVIAEADKAVKEENLLAFLGLVKQFTESEVFTPTDQEYSELSRLAEVVRAGKKVAEGIVQLGLEKYPESDVLMRDHIRHLAHAPHAADRSKAKQIVREKYGSGEQEFQLRNEISLAEVDVYVLALMLDAYHRDGLHEEAVRITARLVEKNPNREVALRNHARAMQRLPGSYRKEEVLAQYKKALLADDATDQTTAWYANALEAYGEPVDALEARVFACLQDLDDPENFARLALSIAEIVQPRDLIRVTRATRKPPDGITPATAVRAIVHAYRCKDYGSDAKRVCEKAMSNIGTGADEIQQEVTRLGELGRKDRAAFVSDMYNLLATDVTK